jgi:hydroxymethylglutaryl-CoA lyase
VEVPKKVQIVEVGPRDGFQMESAFIPTDLKVEIIDSIAAAGVSKIETTSFVSPRVIPQMMDADEVMARITRRPGTRYTALVPNLRGAERAIEAGVNGIRLVVCATETYNRKNVGMSIDGSLDVLQATRRIAGPAGVEVEAVIGVAFGCPFEGQVADEHVFRLALRFQELGITELSVADSVGLANPARIQRVMSNLLGHLDGVALSLHLHDTRGLGLPNALAAMQVGIDIFDSSIGGLGGCPIMQGGTGNISTEDLVNMCHEIGVATGISVARIQETSRRMEEFLGHSLPSHVLAAGTPDQLYTRLGEAGGTDAGR